ncbi:unnamed protein product, partial [Pleuronectes platessa]
MVNLYLERLRWFAGLCYERGTDEPHGLPGTARPPHHFLFLSHRGCLQSTPPPHSTLLPCPVATLLNEAASLG